eukprot:CAMPEP_0172803222 /NCGR_PEP_ID=MMETSP1075-20121228/4331_1 /TAXON_ID=2916 /ORGANISM="Ceratium fusus, Strain PA161109" /LENGTH=201 /DNA_ID=CAMNT_0013641581 /DNA_START=74 /DNA_END=678 /DNA_ORIENTATION=+
MNTRPPLPNIEGLTSLKVDGFYPDTRKDEVWDFFRKCGRIGDVYLPKEPGSQKNRGFAFVRFYDKKDAEMAVQDMDGREFQGQRLRVNFAQARSDTGYIPPRMGSPAGRDNGGAQMGEGEGLLAETVEVAAVATVVVGVLIHEDAIGTADSVTGVTPRVSLPAHRPTSGEDGDEGLTPSHPSSDCPCSERGGGVSGWELQV